MSAVRSEERYSRARPCPICGRWNDSSHPHCHGFEVDGFAYCTSEEYADGAMLNEKCEPPAYVHKREQDGSFRPWAATPPPTPIHAVRRLPASEPTTKTHTTEPGERHFEYTPSQRVRRIDVPGNDKDVKPQYRANGTWHIGDGPGPIQYIYRRQEAAERAGEPLHIFEGETCCEVARALGLRAITWRGGTGRVNKAMAQIVEVGTGEHVILHTDADQPGRKAMHQIAQAILPVAASVKMLDLFPDENPDHGGRDIEDWRADGGDADALARLIADAAAYTPDEQPSGEIEDVPSAWDSFLVNRVDIAAAIENGVEPQNYLIEPLLLEGKVHCIFGGPEQGKTMILLHLVLQALRVGKRVLMLDEEIGTQGTAERLEAMGATSDDLSRLFYFPFATIRDLDEMAATVLEGVQRAKIDLITLDSISKALNAAGLEMNSNDDNTTFMRAWVTPATHVHGATVLYLDHTSKADDDGSYSRGAFSKLADTDVQWHVKAAVAPTRFSMGRLVLTKKKDRWATVPNTVRYIAGGDGTGAIKMGLEASDFLAPVQVNKKDAKYVGALYGDSNPGLSFGEWEKATGAARTSFTDARRRLVNNGTVVEQDEQYFVTEGGARAYGLGITDETKVSPVQSGFSPGGLDRTDDKVSPVSPGFLRNRTSRTESCGDEESGVI